MNREVFFAGLNNPVSRAQLIADYCKDKTVLDLGCVSHVIGNTQRANWIHDRIKEVAKKLVGIDYLADEVSQLNASGYSILCADVTKPFPLPEKFDVIVVGNLIEHLTNFEGLFDNIDRWLNEDGVILISTANPFYIEQYFYSAFKNNILINPEHTCWIDPVALDQLAGRFQFVTRKVYWIKEKWHLKQVICHGKNKQFDMLSGTWTVTGKQGPVERLIAPILFVFFRMLWPKKSKAISVKYDKKTIKGLLYIRLMSTIFNFFWSLYKVILVRSPLNQHELFVSVLRK